MRQSKSELLQLPFQLFWPPFPGGGEVATQILPLLNFKLSFLVPSFKTKVPHFTTEMYDNETFKMDDIFSNETLERINNKSMFEVIAVRTIHYGLSTTLCYLAASKIYEDFYFSLKKQPWNVNLFLHQKGDERWFAFPGMKLKLKKNIKHNYKVSLYYSKLLYFK